MNSRNYYSLHKQEVFPHTFEDTYSQFKHGSKKYARRFGQELAQGFTNSGLLKPNTNVIIYAAPFLNIPTASGSLKDYFVSYIAKYSKQNNIRLKQGYIRREYSYDDDYGKMSSEERDAAISSDIFSLDTGFISDEDVLVFVDDIKITGSHERRIQELLKRYGIKNEVIFVYLAEYTGSDPTVEDRLNHSMVKNLTDITRIITEQDFLFNTRVVKYILKNPEFEQFIKYQSRVFQVTLYNLGIMNDYHNNPKFQRAFEVLETLI